MFRLLDRWAIFYHFKDNNPLTANSRIQIVPNARITSIIISSARLIFIIPPLNYYKCVKEGKETLSSSWLSRIHKMKNCGHVKASVSQS